MILQSKSAFCIIDFEQVSLHMCSKPQGTHVEHIPHAQDQDLVLPEQNIHRNTSILVLRNAKEPIVLIKHCF